jgi:predicted metal-dependent hydrolase
MTIRRPGFVFPNQIDPVLIEGQPELSYLLLALSLSAPYGEPYLLRTMNKAKRYVKDPKLLEKIALFNGQEAQHFRLHRRFNDATGVGCPEIAEIEAELEQRFEQSLSTRSLKWNLAYLEGIEASTVAVARFVLEEQVMRDAAPIARDLFDWHCLEELEHRSVALEVYEHLYGGYAYRVAAAACAHADYCRFVFRVMAVLLKKDRVNGRGLGSKAQEWARMRSFSMQIVKKLLPKVLATYSPGYRPDNISMPAYSGVVLQRLAGWDPIAELTASEPAVAAPAAEIPRYAVRETGAAVGA